MSIFLPRHLFRHQLQCCLCCQHFEGVNALESHLASVHVLYMAYECDFCADALFPSDFALRDHYSKIHDKQSFVVKYRVSPELEERRNLLHRLVEQSVHKMASALQKDKMSTNSESNSYTTQLLENCTSLLQTQLIATNRFLDNSINKKDKNLENNNNGHNFVACDPIDEERSMNEWGRKDNAFPDQKRFSFFADEHNPTFLSSFPITSRDSSLNMKEMNEEDKLELKMTPIKKQSKRRRKAQNQENEQSEANSSQKHQQKGPMVECSGCNRMVGQYRNSMLIHVSTHHCEQPIFECVADGCGKKWYSISARTKEHIEAKHGGNYKLLQDNRSFLLPLLRSTAVRLFQGAY